MLVSLKATHFVAKMDILRPLRYSSVLLSRFFASGAVHETSIISSAKANDDTFPSLLSLNPRISSSWRRGSRTAWNIKGESRSPFLTPYVHGLLPAALCDGSVNILIGIVDESYHRVGDACSYGIAYNPVWYRIEHVQLDCRHTVLSFCHFQQHVEHLHVFEGTRLLNKAQIKSLKNNIPMIKD